MTDEQRKILDIIASAAVECERDTGCPAELTVAQCILESGWLKRAPGNNCFGIKNTDRYPGAQYVVTKEFLDGSWQEKTLAFEVYPSLAECFKDHARLVTSGAPYKQVWAQYQTDKQLDTFILGVAKKYATDPGYADKIARLAHGPNVALALKAARGV